VHACLLAILPLETTGVLGVYCLDHGGVGALRDLWDNIRGSGGGGGFIAG
jgi:hypothetical protein